MKKRETKTMDAQSKSIQRMYFVTVIFSLFAMLLLALYSFSSFYSNAVNNARALGESTLAQEKEHLSAYLSKGIDVLQVTAVTIESVMRNGGTSEEILKILTEESKYYKQDVDENYTGIYGWINGEYLDGIGWVPDEDYVAKERVWYTTAMEADGECVIVSPYLDAQTNTIMISVAKRLYDGESVISYDIALNKIQELTESISLNNQGYGFVCDQEGLVVAHSDILEKGKNYLEESGMHDMMEKAYAQGKSSFSVELQGGKCTAFVVIFCTKALRKAGQNVAALNESRRQLDKLNETILQILAKAIDAKDKYTKGHSVRVAEYSREIAKRMGKSAEEQKQIYNVALLHDVGKIRIPNDIINKPARLTDEEYELIKLHSVAGYHILKDISDNQILAIGAKYHHERYNGKGYPNGLAGENIPEYARIIGVADAYDAMTSKRSYSDIRPQEKVKQEIENGMGSQFDPEIAKIMLQMIEADKDYQMKQNATLEKTVLAVDHDTDSLGQIEEIFKDEPMYHYMGAASGEEALEVLEGNKIDLIFLSIEMPGMNGYEILEKIKEKYDIPVVFMTENRNIDVQKTAQYGVEDYLTKPFLAGTMMEIVHILLN